MSIKIDIKYFDPICRVLQIEKGNWIDVRSREVITLKAGESTLIPLGIAMKLPDNMEAILAPRSSTFKNFGIIQTNSIGVIDTSYSGDNDEWKLAVYATRDTVIPKGSRIAQFRLIERMSRLKFIEVDKLSGPDRDGFGSTGID